MNTPNLAYKDHSLQECQAWLRELDFLLMEVSFLKTRLSHVVDSSTSRSLISNAETYQTSFIYIEETVRRLLAEVRFQNEQISYSSGLTDLKQEKKIEKGQDYLREAMVNLETEFSTLRRTFNQWVIGNILNC